MPATRFPRLRALLLGALLAALPLAACTDESAQRQREAREVTVLKISPQTVSLSAELSARVSAFRKAEVRPQVSGIVQEQLFAEGSMVEQGQSLYKIDPSTYLAAVASAKADLASADAKLNAAKLKLDRHEALRRSRAISEQAYEDANAEYLEALANVDVAKAALRTAEIELRYTDVLAPITGRIGKSSVTQGALATANQAEALAVIQQMDPVYVDMTQSSYSLLRLRDNYAAGRVLRPGEEGAKVQLRLETGQTYPVEGELKFKDITVDESTGAVLLRSVFPNPDGLLLPGMYVRAVINEGVKENALLVPQRAVVRDPKGNASVFVLTGDGTVEDRPVQAADRVGRYFVISEGLSAGELVVVEGLQSLRHGSRVEVKRTLESEPVAQDGGGR